MEALVVTTQLVTWPILVKLISHFNWMCWNKLEFYFQWLNVFSFQAIAKSKPEKKIKRTPPQWAKK